MSSSGALSGEARIASGASTISLLTSGLTTADEGFLAEALRLGGGASPFAIASDGVAADCLRFAAAIVNRAAGTRRVACESEKEGPMAERSDFVAMNGTIVRLLPSKIANINTQEEVSE